jgi:hypothetical protein
LSAVAIAPPTVVEEERVREFTLTVFPNNVVQLPPPRPKPETPDEAS